MHRYSALYGILGALPIFECAARLMSFTKAGRELRMSQPAVSRRIADLESQLGVALFQRNHNKIHLTKEGRDLLDAVDLGLSHLNRVVGGLRKVREHRRLTIACGFSFSAMWLQPRFSSLRDALDGMEVHLITSEFPEELDPAAIDIRILWNDDTWPGRDVRGLFGEDVCPVCSPDFLKSHGMSKGMDVPAHYLAKLPLVHHDSGGPGYLDWSDWFHRHGIGYEPDGSEYRYDNYQFAIQATIDGEGIALGYTFLIQDLLARGDLVRIGPHVHYRDAAMFIEFEKDRLSQEKRDKIHDWFLQQARHKPVGRRDISTDKGEKRC